MTLRFNSRGATHPGRVRTRNEDAYLERSDIGLWAVADGAGGHGAGDVASAAIVEALQDMPQGLSAAELLAQVRLRLDAVHERLRAAVNPDGSPVTMASTVVAAMARGNHFACLWAGDSRAYLCRDGEVTRLTRDHSLVQDMVDAGMIPLEDAPRHPKANVITRAVGAADALQLDKVAGLLEPGDTVILCSDGLHGALPSHDLAALIAKGSGPDELVAEALRNGARDNVTALMISVASDEAEPGAGDRTRPPG
ncbi:protein phosphatase [Alsobacter metallidurans]|uniref:Protein phosphatase n=1 Tax=Alsobacter metallidurans TaxID=340221 RepID=A0A917I7R7_9HYPH|nr:protein phosphatase 2C domain-containing protein [Alsobacter metallidurans]GGH20148.1 protein phosphatase [Alsobacter metallidurans]